MVAEVGHEAGADYGVVGEPADAGAVGTGIDWDAVQAAYEGRDGTISEIAHRFGTTRRAVTWRAHSRHWRPRNNRASATGATMLGRLFRLLDRHIRQLESKGTEMSEKEAAALGRVATTLEKLIQIERTSTSNKPKAASKDLQFLRKKIAERIDELDGKS